nr:hypothetical protein [uncultured Moellerella sp.]
MLSNFNFDISRGGTRDDFKLHEIITTKFSPTTISANNIIFDVNNIISSGNIEAKNDFTIIANKNFTLTQSVLQAGKDLTLDVVELIKDNIVSLIGENVSLFSKNSSIIFDIPHFSLFDETSAKYSRMR